jgi:lipopolysaccharide/colanic/teichoic acid biosynthesis glycosyltransferase
VARFNFFAVPMNVSRRLGNISGFCLTAMLLFCYAPLIGFIALAIYIDSAEPVLLRRMLKVDGRPDVRTFVFRTRRRSDDRRPALFGTFLRNSGLDRLPRLLNVLWGEVPLVVSRATAAKPRLKPIA